MARLPLDLSRPQNSENIQIEPHFENPDREPEISVKFSKLAIFSPGCPNSPSDAPEPDFEHF